MQPVVLCVLMGGEGVPKVECEYGAYFPREILPRLSEAGDFPPSALSPASKGGTYFPPSPQRREISVRLSEVYASDLFESKK